MNLKPDLRLTSIIRWIYKSETGTHCSMKEFLNKGICLVVLLKSSEAVQCCFHDWSSWRESWLTCGQVCKYRTRDLVENVVGGLWNFAGDILGVNDNCKNFDSNNCCPYNDLEFGSCENIDCRKFHLKIIHSNFLFWLF